MTGLKKTIVDHTGCFRTQVSSARLQVPALSSSCRPTAPVDAVMRHAIDRQGRPRITPVAGDGAAADIVGAKQSVGVAAAVAIR